jgi:hypothetical protein
MATLRMEAIRSCESLFQIRNGRINRAVMFVCLIFAPASHKCCFVSTRAVGKKAQTDTRRWILLYGHHTRRSTSCTAAKAGVRDTHFHAKLYSGRLRTVICGQTTKGPPNRGVPFVVQRYVFRIRGTSLWEDAPRRYFNPRSCFSSWGRRGRALLSHAGPSSG